MPASLRSDRPDIAVVALSARALARSARRAGLRALAVDLFADADTREHAALCVRTKAAGGGLAFHRAALLDALKAHAPEGLPVVLGAGFEHTPSLMRAIARRNPILGASPETVALLKNPFAFADLLARSGVPHPAVYEPSEPRPGAPVLSKRAGASGGAHIRVGAAGGARRYLQARVEGQAISALFLADGASARVLGFSEQWTDPTPLAPYRFGGAAGPLQVASDFTGTVSESLSRVAAACGLRGLASADMIATGAAPGFILLEINPRPGATLDVFDRAPWPSLLTLHLDACDGRLPGALPPLSGASASALVHAPRAVRAGAVPRPHWTADWPSCDETVPAGAPFCTVFAAGPDHPAARRLVEKRRTALLDALRSARVPAPTNPMVTQ